MAMPGETIGLGAPATCFDCGVPVTYDVNNLGGGYAIWTWCRNEKCPGDDPSPHSRESGYFPTEAAARRALESEYAEYGRTSEYNPGGLTIIETDDIVETMKETVWTAE